MIAPAAAATIANRTSAPKIAAPHIPAVSADSTRHAAPIGASDEARANGAMTEHQTPSACGDDSDPISLSSPRSLVTYRPPSRAGAASLSAGPIAQLNVSNAAAVALYELARGRPDLPSRNAGG